MKLPKRLGCLWANRLGNPDHKLHSESPDLRCFRTGVRFSSSPPIKKGRFVNGLFLLARLFRENRTPKGLRDKKTIQRIVFRAKVTFGYRLCKAERSTMGQKWLEPKVQRFSSSPPRRSKVRFAPFFFVKKNFRLLPCSSSSPKSKAFRGPRFF